MKSKWLAILVATMMTLSLAVGVAVANPGQGQGPPDHAQNNNRGGAGEDCPAAPAVAAELLSEAGVNHRYGEGPDGGNYVSDVARKMGPGTDFDGVEKCDEDAYREAVAEFLVKQGAGVEAPEPVVGEGEVWNKTQDKYYYTIQDSIDEAEAEDKILVGSGEYEENVVIDADEEELDGLTLMGALEDDRPEIDGSIYVAGVEDIMLKNFVVSNSDSEVIDGNSIYTTDYTTGTIENILAENSAKDGIRADTIGVGSEITIKNSISQNNAENGITLYAPGNIINNKVANSGERGIYIVRYGGGDNVVSGNEVYGSQMGHGGHHSAGIEIYQYAILDDTDGARAEVEDNTVYDNYGNGIMLYKVNPNAVEDNESVVKGNAVYGTMNMEDDTPAGDGIMLYKSNYVTVEDNVIDENDNAGVRVTGVYPYGVFEDSTTNNSVIDNEITNNYYGVLIQEGAEDTVVEDNEYEGNEEDEKYDY